LWEASTRGYKGNIIGPNHILTYTSTMLSSLIVCALLSLSSSFSPAGARVVDLGYAQYESDVSLLPGVTSFLGIRYAEAPIG